MPESDEKPVSEPPSDSADTPTTPTPPEPHKPPEEVPAWGRELIDKVEALSAQQAHEEEETVTDETPVRKPFHKRSFGH